MKAFLLAVAVALLVCPTSHAAAPRVRVDVRELPARDAWRVTINYSRPVDGILFDATRTPFRSGRWSIVEPRDAAWSIINGKDAIAFARRRQRVIVEFSSDYRPREKDYRVNVPFSDGSRLLYTGHLRSRPLIDVGIFDPAKPIDHDWTFHTDAMRDVRVHARRGRGGLRWWNSDDDTYAYFGRIHPVETERLVLVVDPGLPTWVVPQLERFIPQQFAFFARQTATELDFKPLVLLSYGGPRGSGLSFSGGTLPGVVQIELLGAGWSIESEESTHTWYRRLAHEIFHLWDGQMFQPNADAEWLSEAAAEYFALLAMRDARMLDDDGVDAAIVEATNDCLANLGDASILAGPFRNYYTCGMVTQAIADRALGGIATIYRCIFAEARAHRRHYGNGDFLDAVDHDRDLEQLVTAGITGDRQQFFVDALQRAGIAVSVSSDGRRLQREPRR